MLKKIVLSLFIMTAAAPVVYAQEAGGLQSGNWGIAVTDVLGTLAMRDYLVNDQKSNPWIEGHYFITNNIALKPALFVLLTEVKRKDKIQGVTFTEEGRDHDGLPDYGIRFAADYYMPMGHNIYIYSGPSLGFLAGKFKYSNSLDSDGGTTDYTEFILGARLGVQYMITERFGIFADVGLFYSMKKIDIKETDNVGTVDYNISKDTSNVSTMTSGIGVVFYF